MLAGAAPAVSCLRTWQQGVLGAIATGESITLTSPIRLNDAVVLKNALRADVPRTTVILVPRETSPHCSAAVVQPFLPIVIDIIVRYRRRCLRFGS